MSFPSDPVHIALATECAVANVISAMPYLQKGFNKYSMTNPMVVAAALASVAVECGFMPQREQGSDAYFTRMYQGRKDLGNLQPGDGIKFCGRGFIQLTGRVNYSKYGNLINVDLISNPDAVLVPANAAQIFIEYFHDHGCDVWASRGHWLKVRELINGGTNGLELFETNIYRLLTLFYS